MDPCALEDRGFVQAENAGEDCLIGQGAVEEVPDRVLILRGTEGVAEAVRSEVCQGCVCLSSGSGSAATGPSSLESVEWTWVGRSILCRPGAAGFGV